MRYGNNYDSILLDQIDVLDELESASVEFGASLLLELVN